MPIQLTCSCGRKLQAEDEHAGRRVRCPACGAEMTVPKADDDAVRPAEVVEPMASPVRPSRRGRADVPDEEDDDRPRRRARRGDDYEDGEDRPRRRRRPRDDGEDDDYDHRRESVGTSGKAVAALVCGLLSFCTGLTALAAVILGIMGLVDISRSRGRLGGKGLAIAGLILGAVGGVFFLGAMAFSVLGVRDAAARLQSGNNLKMMVLAMHNYNDANGHLPEPYPDAKRGGPARSKLSWRVQLLPYLEQDNLYRQFHHDEPWDSPHNKALLTTMPQVFMHPNHPEEAAKGLTYYRVFTGPLTPFPPGKVSRISADFPDGVSNTILVVEAGDAVPWTKPDELEFDPNKPLPKLGGHYRSGALAGMGDGTVHVIGPGVSQQTLRAAITASGNDLLGADW